MILSLLSFLFLNSKTKMLLHVYGITGVVWTLSEYWLHRGGYLSLSIPKYSNQGLIFPIIQIIGLLLVNTLAYGFFVSEEFAVQSVLCNVFHYLLFEVVICISTNHRGILFRNLRRHHEGHRHDPSTNFGITTTFWDHFFYSLLWDKRPHGDSGDREGGRDPFISDISLPLPLVCGSPMVLSNVGYLIVAIKAFSVSPLWMGLIYSYTFVASCFYHTFPENKWYLRLDNCGVLGFFVANLYLVLFHVPEGTQQVFYSLVGTSQIIYFFWHRCFHGPLYEFYHIIWHFYTALFPLLMLETIQLS